MAILLTGLVREPDSTSPAGGNKREEARHSNLAMNSK